ncbi:MAG: hypothetical protein BIFFINMI_01982 [Phycisphaerae bacterium]|nr:hypothetical protein [Phycisphaerae bacterium]
MAKEQKPGGQAHQYVRVHMARNLIEAEFLKGLLLSNDIPVLIEDEASETVGIPGSLFGKGVPILAPDTQAEEARQIIADHEESRDDEEDEDEEEDA